MVLKMVVPIIGVDAPCGVGKTTWAFNMMRQNKDKGPFMFATPFLSEVHRAVDELTDLDFKAPDDANNKSKKFDLKELLLDGANIPTTHEMFKRLDSDCLEHIREGGYKLVHDEGPAVLQPMNVSKTDRRLLRDAGCFELDPDGETLWLNPDKRIDDSRFSDIFRAAKAGRLIQALTDDGDKFLWRFPPDVFKAFREVYILTYMFDAQLQSYYFKRYQRQYGMKPEVMALRRTPDSMVYKLT